MADEESIRRCVRDELELNLVQRTRNLIRSAAVSTSRDLDQNVGRGSLSNRSRSFSPAFRSTSASSTAPGSSSNSAGPANSGGTKRSNSAPGHPWRFKKSKPVKIQSIPKTVWLLDKPSEEVEIGIDGEYEDYSVTDDIVLLKGEFDLVSNHKEEDIRRELEEIFSRKFPGITMYDFEFVKRDRNIISTPVVKEGHQWDFAHVKHLCGNGRLYVRLITGKEEMEQKDATLTTSSQLSQGSASTSLSTSMPSYASTSATVRLSAVPNSAPVSDVPPAVSDDEDLPEFGAAQSMPTTEQKVARLAAVFPVIPLPVIRNALLSHGSTERAVNSLLTYRSSEGEMDPVAGTLPVSDTTATREDADRVKGENFTQVFQRLRKQMQPRGMREKLKVDPEDQVMDVFSYYKSPNFDASIPISVLVKGQPAIDTGGVLRQVYSEVFLSMSNNEGIKHIFTGEQFRKVPVFSNELVVNGFFEVLGKMICHSLLQGGPGFPYLSPTVYWYLATGDLQVALAKASCADVSNMELLKYIDKISDAQDSDLAAVVFESEFIQLMCEAGETRVVTADNKLDVLQSLMLHDILVKRKSILDQFRKGLSTLGLLAEIEDNPSLFEECFVHQGGLSNDFVVSCLHFHDPDPCDQDASDDRVYQMLQTFVRNLSVDDLNNFLKFITGTSTVSMATLPHRISVSCHNGDSIFASTCSLELKLPNRFVNYAAFDVAMRSVIEGTSFTTA